MRLVLATAFALVGLAGCYEPQPSPKIVGQQTAIQLPPVQPRGPETHVIGRSVQGRPIIAQVLGKGNDTVLIMATIHGDEPAGTTLVHKLAEHLRSNPQLLENRRVVLVPLVNPDGMALGTRENARGIDLNRNFETNNRINNGHNGLSGCSEPESRALQKLIVEYKPDRIVSIHQPLNCLDYDGAGKALAERLADCCQMPVRKLGARPGSLGSFTGLQLGIPTVTMELPRDASRFDDERLWSQYGQAMLAAVAFPSGNVAK
jgi:protein MpaA